MFREIEFKVENEEEEASLIILLIDNKNYENCLRNEVKIV